MNGEILKKRSGFTLVELLIVVALIAILAGAAFLLGSRVTKESHDAQTKSDLAKIQAALDQFYADQGHYPAALFLDAEDQFDNCVELQANSDLATAINNQNACRLDSTHHVVYLQHIPKSRAQIAAERAGQSVNDVHYCYQAQRSRTDTHNCGQLSTWPVQNTCNYYHLTARLETGDQSLPLTCIPGYVQSIAHHENYDITPDIQINNKN